MALLEKRLTHKTEEEIRRAIERKTLIPLLYGPKGEALILKKEDYYAQDFLRRGLRPLLADVYEPTTSFRDFIGENENKQVLRSVSGPGHKPKSIVLQGSIGCGRGFFAECYAGEIGASILPMDFTKLAEFVEIWGEKGLDALLKEVKEKNGKFVLLVNELRNLSTLGDFGPQLPWLSVWKSTVKIAKKNEVTLLGIVDSGNSGGEGDFCNFMFVFNGPNVIERMEILKTLVTSSSKEAEETGRGLIHSSVDIGIWARKTEVVSSYRNLSDLIDEGKRLAGERKREADLKDGKEDGPAYITNGDLTRAVMHVWDSIGTSIIQHPFERASTIYHELGHSIAGEALGHKTDLVMFSAVSALGFSLSLGEGSRKQNSEIDIINAVALYLTGIMAEEMTCRQFRSGGGSSDFEEARTLLTRAVVKNGFGAPERQEKKETGEKEPGTKENNGASEASPEKRSIFPPALLDSSELGGIAASPPNLREIERRVQYLHDKAETVARKTLSDYEYELLSIADIYISDKKTVDTITREEFVEMFSKFTAEKEQLKHDGKLETTLAEMREKHFKRIEKLREDWIQDTG